MYFVYSLLKMIVPDCYGCLSPHAEQSAHREHVHRQRVRVRRVRRGIQARADHGNGGQVGRYVVLVREVDMSRALDFIKSLRVMANV